MALNGIKSRSHLWSPELEADGLQTPPSRGFYKMLPANTGANHGNHVQFMMLPPFDPPGPLLPPHNSPICRLQQTAILLDN